MAKQTQANKGTKNDAVTNNNLYVMLQLFCSEEMTSSSPHIELENNNPQVEVMRAWLAIIFIHKCFQWLLL